MRKAVTKRTYDSYLGKMPTTRERRRTPAYPLGVDIGGSTDSAYSSFYGGSDQFETVEEEKAELDRCKANSAKLIGLATAPSLDAIQLYLRVPRHFEHLY